MRLTAVAGRAGAAAGHGVRRAARSVAGLPARHPLLLVALTAGVGIRVVVMLAYRPALYFYGDSFEYIGTALRLQPTLDRPVGYSVLLWALKPFPHDLTLLVALQHLFGLTVAVLLYALLRRFRLPGWAATVAVLPVLLDAYQLVLEHTVLSDTLFELLLTTGVVALLWDRRLTYPRAVVGGFALGAAVLVRTVGLPIAVLLVVFAGLRSGLARPRRSYSAATAGALLAALVIPLGGYALWFHATNGSYALTRADGAFLYERVSSFADCGQLRLSAAERRLCIDTPVSQRPPGQWYLWQAKSPLHRLPGAPFGPQASRTELSFDLAAITGQPGDYLTAVWTDLTRSFSWERGRFPDIFVVHQYRFNSKPTPVLADWAFPPLGSALADTTAYWGGTNPQTRTDQGLIGFLISYQRYVYVHGLELEVLLIVAGAGVLLGWGDRRQLPATWLAGVAFLLLLLPAMTAEYDDRYVLPANPLAAAAAALGVACLGTAGRRLLGRRRGPATRGHGPVVPRPATQPAGATPPAVLPAGRGSPGDPPATRPG